MSPVQGRIFGSGDTFGSSGRLQTCISVRTRDDQFLIDCGASALIAMRRFRVDPNATGMILLTHFHGDHFGVLPLLILDAQLVSKRARALTVAGSRDERASPAGDEWTLPGFGFHRAGDDGAKRGTIRLSSSGCAFEQRWSSSHLGHRGLPPVS